MTARSKQGLADLLNSRSPTHPQSAFTGLAGAPGELARYARIAWALGSPFVAAVLEAGERQLPRAPLTAALIANWPGDPAASALAMRFNAALHALARRGEPAALAQLYRGERHDFDVAIGAALDAHDPFIAQWMRTPTQTNEIGRAAAILSALMVAADRFDMPFELLEMGASAGLNLNLARYAYHLGGVDAGDPSSPVHIAPGWFGPPPPQHPVRIAATRGADLSPLDPADAHTRERLLCHVWADQPERARRLELALDLARSSPPRIDRASAAEWLVARLMEPQAAGVCRVVFHSMVRQYLSAPDRAAIIATVGEASRRATLERPLVWISFEWTEMRDEVRLQLTSWPGGKPRALATCHPYGAWIHWRG